MNPMLTDYQRHYIEAHKSANEAIKQLNKFGEHFSQLGDYDKKKLFEQIIAEQGVPDELRTALHYLFFETLN